MMTVTKNIKWEGAGIKLPDGKRIWKTFDKLDGSNDPTGWAISSGGYPEVSEEGVRWLDTSRPLDASLRHYCLIPFINEIGEKANLRTDTPTVFYLARTFKWTVVDEIRGHYYSVS